MKTLENVFFPQFYILSNHQNEVYEDLLDVFVPRNQTTSAAWSS